MTLSPPSPRRIFVTGGSRGIGRAVAERFAAAGEQILVTGRDATTLAQCQAACTPGTVTTAVTDVSDRAAQASLIPWLAKSGVDVVVANAGISRQTPATGGTDQAWRDLLQVNLHGVWATLRLARPWLRQGGRIILMGSDLSRMGAAGFAGYAATKHALLGLMGALVPDLSPKGITINTIAPGWVETDMAGESLAELAEAHGLDAADLAAAEAEAMPLGRFLQADEVAALVVYLAGPQAAAITGQILGIDAGSTTF
jgi:3-hydroxybutyrate dehydrogenase